MNSLIIDSIILVLCVICINTINAMNDNDDESGWDYESGFGSD